MVNKSNSVRPKTQAQASGILSESGHISRFLFGLIILAAAVVGTFHLVQSHVTAAPANNTVIYSGLHGYCLDDYKNRSAPGNKVTAWGCNGSSAQEWDAEPTKITHQNTYCLSVLGNKTSSTSPVGLNKCDDSSGQVWLRSYGGFYNPASGLCLAAQSRNQQLIISGCTSEHIDNLAWTILNDSGDDCNDITSRGDKVACEAANEWNDWSTGTLNHSTLLEKYTDGSAYEAWCADFVSYVYKQAGYSFKAAYDGWDENNANNIQNYNFTLHSNLNSYIPKTGDIAYFDYNGGHVEVVISGGKTPSFIYGNSATIDPTTGNGQMKSNTVTTDGDEGQLVYYLSPN